MADWIDFLRVLGASQALFLSVLLGAGTVPDRQRRTRWIAVALALAVAAYLLAPALPPSVPESLTAALGTLAALIPLLLLLFVWHAFEDRTRLGRPMLGPVVGYGLLLLIAALQDAATTAGTQGLTLALQLAKLSCCLAALVLLWQGRDGDLDPRRRRLRGLLIALLCLTVLTVVVVELWSGWRVNSFLELLGMGLFAAGLLAVNGTLTRAVAVEVLFPAALPPAKRPAPGASAAVLARLEHAMRSERLYARHDLKIGRLAAHLELTEHELRRIINRQLGHRNFNRFINGYRLEEAQQRLRSEPQLPVLTIALDVGFRSISAFNAAFRMETGQTPTRWRQQAPTAGEKAT
ncbi:MAG: AraC family transcriptional regulator [Pseudomonadota bacterium]